MTSVAAAWTTELRDALGADGVVTDPDVTAAYAVLGVTGVGARTAAPDDGPVAKRLDLRWALRGLARDRTSVALGLVDGSLVTGTLDRVAADHLDLAEHGLGEARRASAVRQVRLVPLAAIACVRSG